MGNRLSRIYTRTGDDGTTGLGSGGRIAKDSARMEAIGAVDELNSWIGMTLACKLTTAVEVCLERIQHELFDLGGELSMPGTSLLPAAFVEQLESDLDGFNKDLPPLKEFILPGGSESAARCHLARTVCRRAERALVSLSAQEEINPVSLRYLNRLSDLLFVLARVLARAEGGAEVTWVHGDKR